MAMFKNYLILALRTLRKQKLFSLINILGLSVGMAGFALFALIAGVKLNADRFHKNADRIQAVVQVVSSKNKNDVHSAFAPGPLIPALKSEFPEIEDAIRILPAGRVVLARDRDSFYENTLLFVDPNFLSFFTFGMTRGNPEKALAQPDSLVVSETAAAKYFGKDDPIGRVLTLEGKINLTVTGVVKNIPRTSSITFDFLTPLSMARSLSDDLDGWSVSRYAGFVRLRRGHEKDRLEEKFPAFVRAHFPDSPEAAKRLYLFPLLDIRTNGTHITSFWHSSNRASVFIVFSLGLLLLIIVSLNFINLSTARHMHRVKEIGLRKVIGARRSQLVKQFLGESLLLAFLSLPVAILIYELIQPVAHSSLGSPSDISNSILNYPFLLNYMILAAVVTGLVSGIYPAFFLSSFRPAQVLKGGFKAGRKKRRAGKVLIVFQFSLAAVLILAAGALKAQYGHFIKADLGYERSGVAALPISGEALAKREQLKTEISRRPEIRAVSFSAQLPIMWSSPRPAGPPDKKEDEGFTVNAYGVDYGFVEILGMKMLQGRSFLQDRGDGNAFLINEAAAKRFGWDAPIGQPVKIGDKTGIVIGVVKDYLFDDVGFAIPPSVMYIEPNDLNYMLVKYSSTAGFPAVREILREQWNALASGVPFDCQTLENRFLDLVKVFLLLSGLFNGIGLAAVFFSCLGLLGLASYLTERRIKEIGIRKVLGASGPQVVWAIIREFLILVAVADVIALALVQYGWSKVLRSGILFMTGIGAGTYAIALLLTLLTAFVAVTFRTLKAAQANPARSLRYE